jgi:hypothetical protein
LSCKEAKITYGGRKNCSSRTYMPLASSVIKKYFPSRSSVDSFSSSQFGSLGYLKPFGGGPDGVAYVLRFNCSEDAGVIDRNAECRVTRCNCLTGVASSTVDGDMVSLKRGNRLSRQLPKMPSERRRGRRNSSLVLFNEEVI